MKRLFSIVFLGSVLHCSGQYLDGPGALIREEEEKKVKVVYGESKRGTLAYLGTTPTSLVEERSRSRIYFNSIGLNAASIDYSVYENMCKSYLNPLEYWACRNRYNYIKDAHRQVLQLISTPTSGQINQGVKELIDEKYTHIINTLLKELEEMKWEAEDTTLHYLLFNRN